MNIDFLKSVFADTELQEQKVGKVSASRENLYNPQIFADCMTKDDVKGVRKNVRKNLDIHLHNFLVSAKAKSQNMMIETLNEFVDFYKKTYNRHDFSVSSICDVKKKQSSFGGETWLKNATKLLDTTKAFCNANNIKL